MLKPTKNSDDEEQYKKAMQQLARLLNRDHNQEQ